MSNLNSLILTKKAEKNLSKLQKQFNTYVQKIDELKVRLANDKVQIQQIEHFFLTEIVPLERKHTNKIVDLVYVFDKHYEDPFFKFHEKDKIVHFILEKSVELIEKAGKEELIQIFNKYNDTGTYEEISEEYEKDSAETMKKMMQSFYGLELDKEELSINNPEELQDLFQQKLAEKQVNDKAKTSNTKTEKQLAKEQKLKEEAKNISKTARSIYTDLVKSFHPDREKDEAERIRKTEIMKQVTAAYEKDDLFELLRLKVSLMNTDVASLTMADEQLKYFNKLLKEQINELEANLWELYNQNPLTNNGPNLLKRFGGDAKTMKMKFNKEVNQLKKSIKVIDESLSELRFKENMRHFLKVYQIEEDDFY